MLAGLPPPPAPLSLLQGRPGTEALQPREGRGRWLWELSSMRAWGMSQVRNHLWRVRWSCRRVEARLPTGTTESSPSAPLRSALAMGALAHFQRALQLHSVGPWWPGQPLLLPKPVCGEERLLGLPPLFADVTRPPLNH